MSEQNKMIGYCGYDCSLCAARSDDPNVRQQLINGWKKYFGHEYTVESAKCDGCRLSHKNCKLADKECPVRPCAMGKNIETCVDCEQFPCDKVHRLASSMDDMIFRDYPKSADITEEEYNLCMRQFHSKYNLTKIMIEKKKLPDWLKKYYK